MSYVPPITAEWLLARVRDNGDGCLIWTGRAENGWRDPRATVEGLKGVNVRRAIWAAMRDGRQPNRNQWVVADCGCPKCCEPSHLVLRTRSEATKGREKSPLHRARIAMAKRAKSDLSQEAVRAILASDLNNQEEGDRHGVTRHHIRLIRAGVSRRDYSNPFAGLV